MTLDDFEILAKARRSVRHFKPEPLPDGLLDRLLDITHWAPSGYNLQPAHFVTVSDPAVKQRLHDACLAQKQILEAPVTVVFVGDADVYQNHFDAVMAMEREAGVMTADYENKLRQYVPLAFGTGPAGLGWLWKATLAPLAGFTRPMPSIPAVHRRYWLAKQVMLAGMVFMLAAKAAGLDTVPMEGFDEGRVKRVLGIPARNVVPIVIPVGYTAGGPQKKTRLPVASLRHLDRWVAENRSELKA